MDNLTILFILICVPLAFALISSLRGKNNPSNPIEDLDQNDLDHYDRMNNF